VTRPTFRGHNPYLVAVVGVTVTAVAVLFAYAFGTLHLGEGGYTMSGVFSSTGKLKAGDDVEVAGIRVGTIQSVSPDFQHGHVVVTWKVDSGINLGPQTHADVQAANLLGGQYVALSGPVVRPYLASLPRDQRRVPLSRTSVPYTLNQSINAATNLADRFDTGSVNKILTEAARINPPTSAELATMLADLQKLTGTLNQRAPEVEAIIANSKNLTATLASKDQELDQLLVYGQSLLKTLKRSRNDLRAVLGNGSQAVNTLNQVISKHESDLDSILNNLHQVSGLLTGNNLPKLNIAMAWLGPNFQELSGDRSETGRWLEGGLGGIGPVGASLFGPQPSFVPPNYPYPGVPTGFPNGAGS
jgi:phospholipid/cholesterol/gamma-HCH transport system substrate-binding protein